MFYLYGHGFCYMFIFCKPIIQRNVQKFRQGTEWRFRLGADSRKIVDLIFEIKQFLSLKNSAKTRINMAILIGSNNSRFQYFLPTCIIFQGVGKP